MNAQPEPTIMELTDSPTTRARPSWKPIRIEGTFEDLARALVQPVATWRIPTESTSESHARTAGETSGLLRTHLRDPPEVQVRATPNHLPGIVVSLA